MRSLFIKSRPGRAYIQNYNMNPVLALYTSQYCVELSVDDTAIQAYSGICCRIRRYYDAA